MKRILFVCKGNAFRSPVAAKILKKIYGKNISVNSAGLNPNCAGKFSPKIAINVAKKFDIDISVHKGLPLNKNLVEKSDLILVFEQRQKDEVIQLYPMSKDKVVVLKKFAGYKSNINISDLKGKSEEEHKKFILEMQRILPNINI